MRPNSVSRLRRRTGISDRTLAVGLISPAGVLILIFGLYPLCLGVFDSFFRIPQFTNDHIWLGLNNYAAVLADPAIQASWTRSVVFVLVSVALQTVLGTAVALLLNLPLRGRTLARGLVLVPFLMPGFVVAVQFRFVVDPLVGIIDYLLQSVHLIREPIALLQEPSTALWTVILVYAWKWMPFTALVVLARLQVIPAELYEAADVDGARSIAKFWYITLPWLMPVLLVTMLLRTIWTATDFDVPYLLAYGGPLNATTTVPLEIRALAFDIGDIGKAAALSVVLALVFAIACVGYLSAYRRNQASMEG